MDESSVSREHQILVGTDGLITIAGGKLTTYRKMSEVVDTAAKLLQSLAIPETVNWRGVKPRWSRSQVPGWPADDNHERVHGGLELAGETYLEKRETGHHNMV